MELLYAKKITARSRYFGYLDRVEKFVTIAEYERKGVICDVRCLTPPVIIPMEVIILYLITFLNRPFQYHLLLPEEILLVLHPFLEL